MISGIYGAMQGIRTANWSSQTGGHPLPLSQDGTVSKFQIHTEQEAKDAGLSDAEIRGLKKSGQIECATCASRKYQDGSDEMVSYKSATHISPGDSASRVRSHEQEHVANAYQKAREGGGKVLQASVSVKNSVCPECGRPFTAGGVTHTKISYPVDRGAAGKANGKTKAGDAHGILGQNFDEVA